MWLKANMLFKLVHTEFDIVYLVCVEYLHKFLLWNTDTYVYVCISIYKHNITLRRLFREN